MEISASYLSIKENLKQNLQKLVETNINYLHADIMDGIFVPNKTDDIRDLLKLNKKLDVHLMVKDIYKYIDMYKELNPEYITIHLETEENLFDVASYIKSLGIKFGLAISPKTPVEQLTPYLHLLDLVLVMSVEPGKGGQTFIEDSKVKIDLLNLIRLTNNYNYKIEVDGGINKDTKKLCENADILVVGSYITNSDNYSERVNDMINE